MELNYATYLRLDELLALQQEKSDPPEHDEMLFIVVHQASELWFLQLLHELEKICVDLSENHLFRVISSFRRSTSIVQVVTSHLDILDTMTPMSFLKFRDRLDSSSGFQSMQFREVEFKLGMKRPDLFEHYPDDLPGLDRARARLRERSVPDHFYDFLAHRGVSIPPAVLDRPVEAAHEPNEEVQEAIFELYRADGQYRILFELMVDFDAALQQWRYRHIKTVERTIGNREGTGGSLGVRFLQQGLFRQAFPDLWAIRHRF